MRTLLQRVNLCCYWLPTINGCNLNCIYCVMQLSKCSPTSLTNVYPRMLTELRLLCYAAEQVQPNKPHKDLPKDAGEHTIQRLDMMRNSKGNLHTAEIRRNMQRIMQVSTTPAGCCLPAVPLAFAPVMLYSFLHCSGVEALP